MVKELHGKLEAFYYAFGIADVFSLSMCRMRVLAAALSLAVNQSGAVQLRTHVLMTPEEMDQASKKSVGYRAPGK